MARGAARVTKINETTRAKIQDAIVRGLEAGSTINDVADSIEGIGVATIGGLDLGALFDEYRAEMIARTELMDAYNSSAIASYTDAGIDYVQAIDGDGDPECAARDGEIYSSDDADSIEDHPNGTLDWVPVIDDSQKAAPPFQSFQPFLNPTQPEPGDDPMRGNTRRALESAMELLREDAEHEDQMRVLMESVAQQKAMTIDSSPFADAIDRLGASFANFPAPIVNVAPPVVNVAAPDLGGFTDAINSQTEALRPKPTVKTVQRDASNRIASVTETPMETP
jgi:SPP1 gp7 family putative phage head morphogenesis protein